MDRMAHPKPLQAKRASCLWRNGGLGHLIEPGGNLHYVRSVRFSSMAVRRVLDTCLDLSII